MKIQHALKRLAKFSLYILGRRPDEFGLVPDADGYVKLKDFLKAVTEEEGWRHVRRSHIDEILLADSEPGIEISANRIRARERAHLPAPRPAENPPKLLYTCVRRRAYRRIQQKGISAPEHEKIVLTAAPELALRLGRRKDNDPVLLTIQAKAAKDSGTVYQRFGEQIYLSDFIPSGCFQGPPLPKEKPAVEKQSLPERGLPTEAGTFRVDPSKMDRLSESGPRDRKSKKSKGPDWKRDRRRQRRQKDRW